MVLFGFYLELEFGFDLFVFKLLCALGSILGSIGVVCVLELASMLGFMLSSFGFLFAVYLGSSLGSVWVLFVFYLASMRVLVGFYLGFIWFGFGFDLRI